MSSRVMKVRIKVSIAGKMPDGREFGFQPEQVVLMDADLAEKWISVGHAEKVAKDVAVTETAALRTDDWQEHDPRAAQRLQHFNLPM
jgi:hypothetical protein